MAETKAIICLPRQSIHKNPKMWEFTLSNQFAGLHVWQNRAMDLNEFNEVSETVMKRAIQRGFKPFALLVNVDAPKPKKKATKKAAKKKGDK
tara:strand:- start:1148 stop:1423 length:276 start_codon:yes stop_codon:yes gene_type:complete